jgi:putative addiction module component (TIGR02574 family)
MNTRLEILEAEVLRLDSADRLHLLERLICSLDIDPQVDTAWAAEADRREAELASGSVTPVSLEDTLAKLRHRLAE